MEIIKNMFKGVRKYLWTQTRNGENFTTWISGGLRPRTRYELMQEYTNLVYACISVIAEEVAKYDPRFLRKTSQPGKPQEIRDHPFKKLLENPNPYMSQFELFEATSSYKSLTGDAFWYLELGEITRKPKAIYILRPDKVNIAVDDKTGDVLGYTFRRNDGTTMPLDVDEVLHHKTFNPLDPYRGLGTVQAGLLYIETEESTSLFQHNFMKNQATPSGVLTLKGKISTEAFGKLKKKWKEQQVGLKNVGKTLIIREMDAKFEKIGLSLSDLDMAELKKMTSDNVMKMFRVPKPLLGETDSTGLGRSNVEAVEYIFSKRTIDPELTRLDDTLSQYVRRVYGDENFYIEHESQVPADKEMELKERDLGVDRWIKRNEIRAAKGQESVEGGDTLYYNFNQVPIDQEPDTSGTVENAVKAKVHIITRSHPQHNHKHIHNDNSNGLVKDAATESFMRAADTIENKSADEYDKNLQSLLKVQEKEVLKEVKKYHKEVNTFDGIRFELSFTDQDIRLDLLPALINAIIEGGKKAVDFTGEPDQDFILGQATRDAVLASTKRLTKSFNEETALKLQKQIADGLAKGESVKELTSRVESIYEEAKGYRAVRIARTEAHNATNEGVAQGYLQSGIRELVWVAQPGACEFCRKMNGLTVEIGKPFIPKGGVVIGTDGGEYINDYEDVKYANLHPSCDCRILPKTRKSLQPNKKLAERLSKEDIADLIDKSLDKKFNTFTQRLLKKLDE